ncbi:MAG: iron-containing alcohol dehydrogenase [Candidatus Faecivivens sp.]|nr:iron-containing alcohol dehydrogenase [Oscillospiraceae bacterium]MDY2711805.1 iron-containing alcohol dehydrogenase [Candidatus Faecivivens sp.]
MEQFSFYTPTKVIFGKGVQSQVGAVIKSYGFKKILFHYGSGSIKKSGLYDQIVASLRENGIEFVELGGVQPNPKLSLSRKAAQLCIDEKVEMILAVGGGSVLDSSKSAAAGAANHCDPWEFSSGARVLEKSLPVGAVLTIAAAGSEMSDSCVITNEEGWLKRGFNSDHNRPLFAIMNPELTYTVSKYQTACGVTDIMMHTLERYFCMNGDVALTDHLAEGLLRSVIEAGKVVMDKPDDYEARATLMWASSLSHNGLTGCGRNFMMRCHQIEHELSGMYDRVAHGAGLAVIFPAWAKYIYKNEKALPRFCQFAQRVWGIEMDFEHPERTALAGIEACENFFKSLGMPVRLSELDVDDTKFDEMAEKCTFFGKRVLKDYIPLGKTEIIEIYNLAK